MLPWRSHGWYSQLPDVRRRDDGLREQDALRRLEAVREFLYASCVSFHDQDLEARLLVHVRVGRRPDRPEEIVLPVKDPMRHHSDVVAVDERDRADDLSARFPALPDERAPNELPQRLGPTRESFGADEPIEIVEEPRLERDADAVHGHVLPRTHPGVTEVFKAPANV